MNRTVVRVFFNFRSPYCYLASRSMFERLGAFDIELAWYSLGGWDGRSPPERAKVKVPLTRQDVARWCRRLAIPFNPPPITTDPTPAALVSFAAERAGRLADYVKAVMWAEWAEGEDIGQRTVLTRIAGSIDLTPVDVAAALSSSEYATRLADNWTYAGSLGVIGVPTFIVGEEIFWGNDRLDFLEDHLTAAGLDQGPSL